MVVRNHVTFILNASLSHVTILLAFSHYRSYLFSFHMHLWYSATVHHFLIDLFSTGVYSFFWRRAGFILNPAFYPADLVSPYTSFSAQHLFTTLHSMAALSLMLQSVSWDTQSLQPRFPVRVHRRNWVKWVSKDRWFPQQQLLCAVNQAVPAWQFHV